MKAFQKLSGIVCILSLLLSLTTVGASAEGAISWYVPRNGTKQPTLPQEELAALEHGAYYMNTAVRDDDTDKVLYLTFDAGYENGHIESILNTLRDEQVPAAFFILDHLILKNTDLVVRMKDEGHLVCNHTKNHKNMTECTKEAMVKDLTDLEKIYTERTGYTMDKFFRFPEGRYNEASLKYASELGYKTVFWSFAYDDWNNDRQPPEHVAIQKILDNTHNGAVLLLHPTSKTNAAILPTLIREWRSMGYRFGTLEELCQAVDAQRAQATKGAAA